jgi:hypothetical protein
LHTGLSIWIDQIDQTNFVALDTDLIFLLMVMATILTQPIWIDSTSNIWRSGVVTATQIANHIADPLNVLLFGIAIHALVKAAIGARLGHRQPPAARAQSLTIAQPRASQQ